MDLQPVAHQFVFCGARPHM